MKRLTCEICGSTDIIKKDDLFVCQTCGCKYSVEAVKNLLIDVAGKADHSNEIENLLKRAFMQIEDGMWGDAYNSLEEVLKKDPENARAYVGKLMIQLKAKTEERIAEIPLTIEESINYQHIMQFGDSDLKARFMRYAKKQNPIGSINQIVRSTTENHKRFKTVILIDDVDPYAFCEDTFIEKVIMLDGVKNIGESAFSNCIWLNSVTLPNTLKSIGNEAFRGCATITCLRVPKSVTYIGGYSLNGPQTVKYDGTTKDLEKVNAYYCNIVECTDTAEIRRKQQEQRDMEVQARKQRWKASGLCQHCGGSFKGVFTKQCIKCGKKKDY